MKLDTLILVHKTHLDVGFTDTAAQVTHQYLEQFIPAAMRRAREMNREGEPPRFVWTTGSWIIWKALRELPPEGVTELEDAIQKGWVKWHALPFTFHTELLSPTLLRLALRFGQDLDQRFGLTTRSAKMTDVPGHTQGLIPILAEAGIQFLHIGVNPASRVPDVPPLFRWSCGDTELLCAYAGTYGSITQTDGLDTGLGFLHTNDNLGPPEAETIQAEEDWLRTRFGVRQVIAGGMDTFVERLLPFRKELPVVDREIGDSWIHGAASDPSKLADYLAMRRSVDAQAETLLKQPLDDIAAWLEPLLLIPEHTWGLDVKAWFGDHGHFGVSELQTLRRSHRVRNLEASWEEQRDYVHRTLGAAPALLPAVEESRNLRCAPSSERMEAHDVNAPLQAGRWLIRLEPATGALTQLFDQETGREFCPGGGRLNWGVLHYEQYGHEDYSRFLDAYMGPPPRPWWAEEDFNKFGLPRAQRRSSTLRGDGVRVEQTPDRTRVLIRQQFFGDAELLPAAPEHPALLWTFHAHQPIVDLQVGWDRKAATRMPEALWLGFRLEGHPRIRIQKLGQQVDPQRIVSGGGVRLHAVQDRIEVHPQAQASWQVEALDSALLATNGGRLLDTSPEPPGKVDTLWFNLMNNIWNTNFRLWNEGPMGYRFRFDFRTG